MPAIKSHNFNVIFIATDKLTKYNSHSQQRHYKKNYNKNKMHKKASNK